MRIAWIVLVPLLFALGACSTTGSRPGTGVQADDSTIGGGASSAGRRGGGYYLDDGPGERAPSEVLAIPDAVPRPEPVLLRTARPYSVFGRSYAPMRTLAPYRARGIASWYGRRYHGKPTSSGEPYDMYAMTAAHPTLPIPSYVRVTRAGTDRSVVVRINDRGPFLQNRLIDLSYTAAAKLGFVQAGSAEVDVELITQFGTPPDAAPLRVVAAEPAPATAASAPLAGPAPGAAPAPAGAPSPAAAGVPALAAAPATGATQATGASQVLPVPSAAASEPPRLIVETAVAANELPQRSPAVPTAGPALAGAASATAPAQGSAPLASTDGAVPVASPGANTMEPRAAQPVAGARSGSGFWLQFGAFASLEGAHRAIERLRRELDWIEAPFDVRREGALYKVQAGPWPGRAHALDAAERVRRATALRPFAIFR